MMINYCNRYHVARISITMQHQLGIVPSGPLNPRWHIDPFERMLNTAKNVLPRLQLSIASLQTSPQK
jgi:hypothetical protein